MTYRRNLTTRGLTLKSLLVGTLVAVGIATAADARSRVAEHCFTGIKRY